jgi:hypothetical protein
VRDEVVHGLWRDESSLIAQPVAASSSDAVLRELAASLAPDALIADLRQPTMGSGFAWGKFGPRTVVQRFGEHRLWALTKPPAKPGFFSRLFGR